jgi:hypothetical protein
MQLPREPRPGDQLDAAFGAQVIRYLRAITPTGGPGVLVREYAGGTTFQAAPARPGGSIASIFPFKVLDASDDTPAAKVSVVFGQVNDVTPTMDGHALDADPAPTLEVISGVIYLKCTLDGTGAVTGVEVLNAAAKPADDATHAYITLATVTVASDAVTAINQSVTHSLRLRKCGVADMHFWGV